MTVMVDWTLKAYYHSMYNFCTSIVGCLLQLLRAANLVVSSAKFLRSLKDEVLAPEVYHLNPKASDTDSFRRFVKYV